MEIDGYIIQRDETFPYGEQYFVTKNRSRVGFIRMNCGVLRVSASYPPASLLLCESMDDSTFDSFNSCRDRRAAMRKAVKSLEAFYRDAPSPFYSVAKVFPDFVVETKLEQGTLPF